MREIILLLQCIIMMMTVCIISDYQYNIIPPEIENWVA